MNRRKGYLIYICIIIGLCLLPFVGMTVRPTTQTTENKELTEWPILLSEEGYLNMHFLEEAGTWFTDHFSFRQELVGADAKLRGEVFQVSAVDSVILGKNGWLYYEATLDDYQHKDSISERMLFNIAHNVSLMQEYSSLLGKKFIFTIAPNKNSLYGENMPDRYNFQYAEQSDAERLTPWLEREGVNYVDLFELFAAQDEVLYYERDSHWNNKGAVLVYEALMEAAETPSIGYESLGYDTVNDYYGDLNLMLYPLNATPEKDYSYHQDFTWTYLQGGAVTDQYIQTSCSSGKGKLLLYRDSFGNTLLPYFAQTFSKAAFSQVVPYQMTDLVTAAPDVVILEKVERHLPTLGSVAPIMSAPARQLLGTLNEAESSTTLNVAKEGIYWRFTGIADESFMDEDSRIYLEVSDGMNKGTYEAFCMQISEEGVTSDYGYQMYLSEITMPGPVFLVKVIVQNSEGFHVLYDGKIDMQ